MLIEWLKPEMWQHISGFVFCISQQFVPFRWPKDFFVDR
ncbi:hypothetical protein J699_01939 [Acinetobacter sp. 1000160]|nr:hypothetical protein J522_1391 [Acinetobacter baumannii 146457]EYT20135.1 hypothetical protein J699_01939 [Acinetobacter sp. 1000160]